MTAKSRPGTVSLGSLLWCSLCLCMGLAVGAVALAQEPGGGGAPVCPPAAGVETHPQTFGFFDVFFDAGGAQNIQVIGPTTVSHGDPVRDTVETEILQMELHGALGDGTPVVLRQSPDKRSIGQAGKFASDALGGCVAAESFFDVFFEVEIGAQQKQVFINNQPLRLIGKGIPIPHTREFDLIQDPQAPPPALLNKANGARIGLVRNTRHSLPPPPPPNGFKRGDANCDGCVDRNDMDAIAKFLSGAAGLCCMDAADANDDGKVNGGDINYLGSFLAGTGAPPPPPGPDRCGIDSTEDPLDCKAYPQRLCDVVCERPPPCFPPAGRDIMSSKLLHDIDIPGVGLCRAELTGPMVVARADPKKDPATGRWCIDTEILSMDLTGEDPVCGRINVTLSPFKKSVGQICEEVPGTCFPALSCFDVFIKVELPDLKMCLYACKPAKMCCRISAIPPFGCRFNLSLADGETIPLYPGDCAARIDPCARVPLPAPAGFIVRADLEPLPPEACKCFPPAGEDVLDTTLVHQIEIPGLNLKCSTFKGPMVIRRSDPFINEDGLCCIKTEVVKLEMRGVCNDGTTPAIIRLCPDRRSIGLICEKERGKCFPATSCFDIFFEVEVAGMILKNCKPATMCCTIDQLPPLGCPYALQNPPIELYRVGADGLNPCLKNPLPPPDGILRQASHQPEQETEPCCPEYGPEEDILDTTLLHDVDIPGIGICKANLRGQAVVRRGRPYVDPVTGLCCVETEMVSLELSGRDPLCGRIIITLDPRHPSRGSICEKERGKCFPAESCFNVFVRIELPDLNLVLVACEPARMCCTIDKLPPIGCLYNLTIGAGERVPLYREIPAADVCQAVPRPNPAAFIIKAVHRPEPPCTCFPPAGDDTMQTELSHRVRLFGLGPQKGDLICDADLRGPVVIRRSAPRIDPITGLCCIDTEMVSLELRGTDPNCGEVILRLNKELRSLGRICEKQKGTCFPANSFFDVFVEIEIPGLGVSVRNCSPARMECEIGAIPPFNCVYQLNLTGVPLYKSEQCALLPNPDVKPIGIIEEAIHIPVDPCTRCPKYGPGVDIMDSTLTHDIELFGLGKLCKAPLRGKVVIERGVPFLNEEGLCCVRTRMVRLELEGNDPACGPVRIRLCPERPSRGLICQTQPTACFPAQSCFEVFIEVEVMGMVLKNCKPAVMCCLISDIPPIGCVYQIDLGDPVLLFRKGTCDVPDAQPVGAIRQAVHIPCAAPRITCEVVDGHANIRVTADPNCPCTRFQVRRDDGIVIPQSAVDPNLFVDPESCSGPRTYTARCLDPAGDPVSVTCPCPPCAERAVKNLRCASLRPPAKGIRLTWDIDAGCCDQVKIIRDGVRIAVVNASDGAYVDDQTDCPATGPCQEHEYCVVCVGPGDQELGPRVCCKIRCGQCDCPERHVNDFTCGLSADESRVILKWTQDPNCPCVKVRIIRDGAVIAEVDAAAGTFVDPCVPGDHEYCIVCIDATGKEVGPKLCCKIACPPPPPCCPEYGPGVDVMGSTLSHDIVLFGLPEKLCKTPLSGKVVVERGVPFRNEAGICCVETKMVTLDLTGNDPVCGPIRIRLCPDRLTLGTICEKTPGVCFPAQSCFDVFIEVEVMGMVLKNCQPARMCCEISSIPPYNCTYQIDLGGPLALYKKGDCGNPNAQPVGEIRGAIHQPTPCPPPRVDCTLLPDGKTVEVRWALDPQCPCERVIVTRINPDGTETAVTLPAVQGLFTDVLTCPAGATSVDYTYCVQCVIGTSVSERVCCKVTLRCGEGCCPAYGPGTDTMNSTLSHDIVLFGFNDKLCKAPLTGPMVVERGIPFRNAEGFCCVETKMVSLDLKGTDPACGEVRIRLSPDKPTTGFICERERGQCFPANSCFNVFVEVEVMGMVLTNCEPAVMCCVINTLPPFGCVYQLNFGAALPLFKKGDCGVAGALPVAEIRQAQHVPSPPCDLQIRCRLVNGQAVIEVTVGDDCCEDIVVTRDDGKVIEATPAGAQLTRAVVDADCKGKRTYTATCRGGPGNGRSASCTLVCRIRGDITGDGLHDISDAIAGLGCMFINPALCPVDCFDVMEVNGDGKPDISDMVYILQRLFLGGPPFVADPLVCEPVPPLVR